MTAKRYIEQVLEKVLKDLYPKLRRKLGLVAFMQDGAPSHTAKSTRHWLSQKEICLLPHPPSSPDLNPIEWVWHELKRLLRKSDHTPTTVDTLKAAILEVWNEISQDFIDSQVSSMPDRLNAVWHAKGGHTKY